MEKSKWVWMPHPGHFICSDRRRFHLNTYVGGYIVSTVGEMLPDSSTRKILTDAWGIAIKGQGDAAEADWMKKVGREDIGYQRKYETMVFRAVRHEGRTCCPWRQIFGADVDMAGYNSPDDAVNGHMKMCAKWSKRRVGKHGA